MKQRSMRIYQNDSFRRAIVDSRGAFEQLQDFLRWSLPTTTYHFTSFVSFSRINSRLLWNSWVKVMLFDRPKHLLIKQNPFVRFSNTYCHSAEKDAIHHANETEERPSDHHHFSQSMGSTYSITSSNLKRWKTMFCHEQTVEVLRHGILFHSPSTEREQGSLSEEDDLYERWETSDLEPTMILPNRIYWTEHRRRAHVSNCF